MARIFFWGSFSYIYLLRTTPKSKEKLRGGKKNNVFLVVGKGTICENIYFNISKNESCFQLLQTIKHNLIFHSKIKFGVQSRQVRTYQIELTNSSRKEKKNKKKNKT
jgi:hypothetical protein